MNGYAFTEAGTQEVGRLVGAHSLALSVLNSHWLPF